jgi:hypothetical protein
MRLTPEKMDESRSDGDVISAAAIAAQRPDWEIRNKIEASFRQPRQRPGAIRNPGIFVGAHSMRPVWTPAFTGRIAKNK